MNLVYSHRLSIASLIVFATAALAPAQFQTQPGSHRCISTTQRAMIAQEIADYVAAHGPLSHVPESASAADSELASSGPPFLYTFYPHAGNLSKDLLPSALLDLDPTSPGMRSFDCTAWTYDGHTGQDTEIRGFEAMAVGVPVFAVHDGTVVYVHDGEPDDVAITSLDECGALLGNGVMIDHGNGRTCIYWHFKTGSISVSLGQFVRAGTQLGLTGSSGCSTGPHLHFETVDNYQWDISYESFAGPCRPGPSGWVDQPVLTSNAYIWNFSVTATDPFTVPSMYPYEKPRDAQIAFTDTKVYTDMVGIRSRPSGTYRYRFYRPDSSLAHDTGVLNYPNNQSYWLPSQTGLYAELWLHYQGFDIPDMHSIAGMWRVTMDMDGVQILDAPIEVVPVRDPSFNRPPQPITASFDPPAPSIEDVLFCRVADTGAIYLTDLDWDLVRYHYVWKVDGNVVRDIVTAAQADALSRLSIPNGSLVECTVTPSDGEPNGVGNPVTISVSVSGDCTNGFDCDNTGVADMCEIASGISEDCDGDSIPDQCEEDCNQNGVPDDCEAIPLLAGSTVYFDGINDTIALGQNGMNVSGTVTMEAWIKIEETDGIRIIFAQGSPFTKKATGLATQDNQLIAVSVNNGIHNVYVPMLGTDIGKWIHLAGVYTGSAWRLYRNGELAGERPTPHGAAGGSAPWAIGSGTTGGGFSNFFKGGIDEVRLWNVARTQAQIQSTMFITLTGNEPGLKGYWRLDEGSGLLVQDSAPQGGYANGTLVSGPAWITNQPCVSDDAVLAGDFNLDQAIDDDDLVILIAAWGACGSPCRADLNDDGTVAVDDLLQLMNNWNTSSELRRN